MAILLSGDFHNGVNGEIEIIKKESLLSCYEKGLYDKIKYHIILEDAGFLWPKQDNIDNQNFKILSEREFPILCIMGNHEPVYGRNDLSEEDIGIGEKVIVVNKNNPFVAYLKRGKIYTIDGKGLLNAPNPVFSRAIVMYDYDTEYNMAPHKWHSDCLFNSTNNIIDKFVT